MDEEKTGSRETVKKRSKRAKIENFKGKDKVARFDTQNQPDPETKKAGWAKKKKGQELVRAILDLQFKGANDDLKQKVAEYFGVDQSEITIEMMLNFRQAEKAIQNLDTPAYNAFMDRGYGKPKEKHEVTGEDGNPILTELKIVHIQSPVPLSQSEEDIQ